MKVYGSDTDASQNGTPLASDDPDDYESWAGEEGRFDYSQLFDAPNYADFIKTAPNSKARSYEKRVQSMVKAGMVASINNQQWPDAATFLKHGPGFAKAAGNLAAEDARAAALVEMLTAPDSPYVMFAMVAIPFVAQLVRNHQPELHQAGLTMKERRTQRKQARMSGQRTVKPPITVHLLKREFKIPIRLRVKMPNLRGAFKAFLAPTQQPEAIAQEVFQDPAVVKALHKMGLYPQAPDTGERDAV